MANLVAAPNHLINNSKRDTARHSLALYSSLTYGTSWICEFCSCVLAIVLGRNGRQGNRGIPLSRDASGHVVDDICFRGMM